MARKSKRQQQQEEEALITPFDATLSSHTRDSSSDNSSESEVTPEVATSAPVEELLAPVAPGPASKPFNTNTQVKNTTVTSESTTTPPTMVVMNGTIHVKVLKASNLPTMNFGKRQDPVVLVQLENSSPKSWAATDPAFNGNTSPEWSDCSNNELEVFYDAKIHRDKAILTVEVYSNETGDELIGSGQLDVSSFVQKQSTDPDRTTVRLDGNRGEVVVQVWFGPPVRRAFRAAGRATKLLDIRDAFVGTLHSILSSICGFVSNYTQMPTDFAKKHRKLSMAAVAALGIMAAGTLTMFLVFAVPTMLLAFFTFPFWIIPFLVTSFFTAPLWVPIVLLVGLFLLFIATFVFGLGATSRPVRRKGALISNKIKHSSVGKRVVYEKIT